MEANQKADASLDGQAFTLLLNDILDVKEITDQFLAIGVLCRLEE